MRRGYARFRLPAGKPSSGMDGCMNAPDNGQPPLLLCRDTAVPGASRHLATGGLLWQMARL